MGQKLNPQDAGVYAALDRLLFWEWDPLGVHDIHGPEDEYHAYLPGFWKLVTADATAEDIAAYLRRTEVEALGVESTEAHRLDIAKKALALRAAWRLPVRD